MPYDLLKHWNALFSTVAIPMAHYVANKAVEESLAALLRQQEFEREMAKPGDPNNDPLFI